MKLNKVDFINKIHLIISLIIVVPVSFVYGFNPNYLFDIHLTTIDEHNIFKAIMGLYLGFSIVWILGIFKINYLKSALFSNMIFMLGLGIGRAISFVYDGLPVTNFILGAIGELILGFYGLWVITRKKW